MRRGQRVQVAGRGADGANLITAANAVVVVIVGARNQLRRAGAAAGKLEKGHLIGRRRRGDKALRRAVDSRVQRLVALAVAQQHGAHAGMRPAKVR